MYDYEREELLELKVEDNYHFSVPFEYIEKRLGNDEYEVGTATMEVDVTWNDDVLGYTMDYYVPEESKIDPNEGNSDIEGFFDIDVEPIVRESLVDLGVAYGAIAI